MTLYQINAALQRVRCSSMMKQKEIHLFPNEFCASYPSSFVENQFRTFFMNISRYHHRHHSRHTLLMKNM